MYFYLFLLPTLAGLLITYLYSYYKHFYYIGKKNDDILPNNSFYSSQEILSSSHNYIPLHISNQLPDYSKHREGKTKEGISYFMKIFNGIFFDNTRFLLLGSAGIGKTTFLLNLYNTYYRYLPENTNIQLFPLRTCDLEKEIQNIKHPKQTILLLDGLDEIPVDSTLSLDKLIRITEKFKYVIITSRIEFFKEDNPELLTNTFKYSGDKGYYNIKKIYLLPFSKKEIKIYLNYEFRDENKFKQFFNILFGANDLVYKAEILLDKIKFASLKPLFLCYITEIIKDDMYPSVSDSEMYESLINKWIKRESYNVEDKIAFIESMYKILINIALSMELLGKQYLTENEIEKILFDYQGYLTDITIKSKSLLVKNEKGHFYFFHTSISDYLLAKNKYNETKGETLIKSMKIDINCSLYTHFINEMGLNYLFETRKIKALFNGEFFYDFTEEWIDSWKDFLKIKYFKIISCDLSLDIVFKLFHNIQHFVYKDMKEEDLQYLIHLKKIEILDISGNEEIKNLSFLNNISTLNKLIMNNSNVDLSTLTLSNNSIEKIIVSKSDYTYEELKKLFPSEHIKQGFGDGFVPILIINSHKGSKLKKPASNLGLAQAGQWLA